MKRLLCIVAGLFVSLNLAYANDLLFKASNGALNQNSVGVKKLTDKEMAQVKGGLNYSGEYNQYRYTNSYGQVIRSSYVAVSLTQSESRMQSINLNNGRNGYDNYTSFIAQARAGTPIIHIQHNETTGYTTYSFAIKGSSTYYIADRFGRGVVSDYRARYNRY